MAPLILATGSVDPVLLGSLRNYRSFAAEVPGLLAMAKMGTPANFPGCKKTNSLLFEPEIYFATLRSSTAFELANQDFVTSIISKTRSVVLIGL